MKPIKIRVISNDTKKIKTNTPSELQTKVGVNTERYIDYTDFQDGYVMVYDEEKNRYHFVNPDKILSNTYKQDNLPQTFSDEILNEIIDDLDDNFDIDMVEY